MFKPDSCKHEGCQHHDPDEGEHSHCDHALPCPVFLDDDSDCASSVGCAARVLTFNDKIETFPVPLGPGGDFTRQLPRDDGDTSRPITAGTVSPHDDERAGWTLWSLANARQRAIDLASGIGWIIPASPDDDTSGEEWTTFDLDGNRIIGARRHKDETRCPVLFWEPDVVSTFVPFADGFSSYGRLSLTNFEFVSIPRVDGMIKYDNHMDEYEDWGDVPSLLNRPRDPMTCLFYPPPRPRDA